MDLYTYIEKAAWKKKWDIRENSISLYSFKLPFDVEVAEKFLNGI